VRQLVHGVIEDLAARALAHDASKLVEPEASAFHKIEVERSRLVYGSDEYKAAMASIQPAIDHHYEKNDHHPEHEPNGINDMSLMQITEMICDWRAASERLADSDFAAGLEISRERFGIEPQLYSIICNTARAFGWIK
jgi:hypothetical protein